MIYYLLKMTLALTEWRSIPSQDIGGPPSECLFPDGIKTSGQHPPLYDKLHPFNDFPEEVSGPTVWRREDYIDNPERWVHEFDLEEIRELSNAADDFITAAIPLTGITKVSSSIGTGRNWS